MLEARHRQGAFGEEYVGALAAAAGLLVYRFDHDLDGIDLGVRLPGPSPKAVSPGIEMQVKSWSRWRGAATAWRYDGLSEPQFNNLAGPDFAVPRYLVLVLVPDRPDDYATVGAGGLLLRYVAYYVSLRDQPRVAAPDRRRRRPVTVPVVNVLTTASLRSLVDQVPASGAA